MRFSACAACLLLLLRLPHLMLHDAGVRTFAARAASHARAAADFWGVVLINSRTVRPQVPVQGL